MKKKTEKHTAADHYLALVTQLQEIRTRHHGKESLEERIHQEEMDKAFSKLEREREENTKL